MRADTTAALFLLLGRSAEGALAALDDVVPSHALLIAPGYDLAQLMPERVRRSLEAAESYKLFFVFEGYLREFVLDVLSRSTTSWWEKIPDDVRNEVAKLEGTEETKGWMALNSRDKSALLTYPQLLRIVEHCWKDGFNDLVLDKALINQARLIGHLRNTICHMTEISAEEHERIKQVMRDWFRVVAP